MGKNIVSNFDKNCDVRFSEVLIDGRELTWLFLEKECHEMVPLLEEPSQMDHSEGSHKMEVDHGLEQPVDQDFRKVTFEDSSEQFWVQDGSAFTLSDGETVQQSNGFKCTHRFFAFNSRWKEEPGGMVCAASENGIPIPVPQCLDLQTCTGAPVVQGRALPEGKGMNDGRNCSQWSKFHSDGSKELFSPGQQLQR